MSNATNNKHADAHESYQHLLANQQSLNLATINQDGSPLSSYTPFVVDEQRQFYIFVSQLASHTVNLQRGSLDLNIFW